MTYTVFYRKPGWRFWRKIKKVTGDSQLYDQHMRAVPGVRVLYFADSTRLELPAGILLIKFSQERNFIIEQNKQKEIAAGGLKK